MKYNEENAYDLAIEARKMLNQTISELKLFKLDCPDYNTDLVLINMENELNEGNIYLKSFENEWM